MGDDFLLQYHSFYNFLYVWLSLVYPNKIFFIHKYEQTYFNHFLVLRRYISFESINLNVGETLTKIYQGFIDN